MVFAFRGPLLRHVAFQREIRVEAETVQDSIDSLCCMFPDLRPVLLDAGGRVRPVHRLALNQDLLARTELGRAVGADDCVEVLTAIAGG